MFILIEKQSVWGGTNRIFCASLKIFGFNIHSASFQLFNSSFPYVDTLVHLIKMGETSANFLNLSESSLNSLKKSELVQEILDVKGNVIANAELQKLSDQISKLTEAID